ACGADLTEEADSGYTPMDLAVALGHKKGKCPSSENRDFFPLRKQAMEKFGNFCLPWIQASPGVGMAGMPKIQGHSFQPWLGSAAPCFPLEVNS
ncbi:RFXK protein, partial [Phainopepla nitens]|nr:RFXK protein [Phainopepla nitens]